jgi:Phage tail tube protein, GTA-gp10
MSARANAARGEATININNAAFMLRPTFAALVAAEEELGPLFGLVERAASGMLTLSEMVTLFWHCLADQSVLDRAQFSEGVVTGGLVNATPALKILIAQILGGR